MSTDQLIDDLWPDGSPKAARSSLQLVVKRARDVLADEDHRRIVHAGGGYRLEPGEVASDLAEWRAGALLARENDGAIEPSNALTRELERLRSLWRGEAFAGVPASGRLDIAARILDRERLDLLLTESVALVAIGRPGLAIGLLEQARQRDPLREDIAVLAVDALAASGRRKEALALASSARELFRTELGISPSSTFAEAERRALLGSPAERAEGGNVRKFDSFPWRPDVLNAVADDVVIAARAGRHHFVNVVAAPESGRSSFLEQLANACNAREVVTHVARRAVDQPHSLRTLVDPRVLRTAVSQQAEHLLLADRLAQAAAAVLVVDDAEALDSWSHDFLTWLASTSLPIVAVVGWSTTARPDVGPDSAEVELDRLSREEVTAVVARRFAELDATALARRAYRWSEGRPSLLREALHSFGRDPAAPLPDRADRPGALEQPTLPVHHVVLELVGILGGHVRPQLLRALLPDDLGADAVAALLSSGHLVSSSSPTPAVMLGSPVPPTDATPTGFDPSLLVGAARVLRAEGEIVAAALCVARVLGDGSASDPELDDWLIEGINELEANGRLGEAADLLALAAELASSPAKTARLRYRMARALEWSGRVGDAEALYDQLVDTATASPVLDTDLLAVVGLAGGGHSGGSIGGQDGRRRRLAVVHRRLPMKHPAHDLVTAELAYERWAARHSIDSPMIQDLERIAASGSSSGRLLAQRLLMALQETHQPASLDSALMLANDAVGRAVARGATTEDRTHAAKCLVVAVAVAMSWGELAEAESMFAEIEMIGERTGMPQARWQSLALRAALLDCRGRTAEADVVAEQARRLGAALAVGDATPTFFVHHLGRAYRGGSLAVVAGPIGQTAERFRFPAWFALRGLAALDSGDERSAREALGNALAFDGKVSDYFRIPGAALTLRLAARLRHRAGTDDMRRRLDPFAGRLLFLGYGGAFLGPVDWYRSHADRLWGSTAVADRMDEEALRFTGRCGALGWIDDPLRTTPA